MHNLRPTLVPPDARYEQVCPEEQYPAPETMSGYEPVYAEDGVPADAGPVAVCAEVIDPEAGACGD